MNLSDLTGGGEVAAEHADVKITGLTADSRAVQPGFLFAAMPGAKADGVQFIEDALGRGAAALLLANGLSAPLSRPVPIISDANPRRRLALLTSKFYSAQPDIVAAVTGTNGKTSVAAFLRQIWEKLGHRAASMGTVGTISPLGEKTLTHTTPDPVTLHAALAELAGARVSRLALEASSHGLDQHRLDGVKIAAGAFTNITRDHLDYHADFEAYLKAKLRLFRELMAPGGAAVINADQPEAARIAGAALSRRLEIFTVGQSGAGIKLIAAERDGLAQRLSVRHRGKIYKFRLPLAGGFQASNALIAAGLAITTGSDPGAVFAALESIEGARGRLELAGHAPSGAPIFIDYAHTPDALEKALQTLRPYAAGKLAVVFGCGGDRDRGKRPLMGAIAARLADRVYVTDDNPRSEDAGAIRLEILAAAPSAADIGGRAEAIAAAIAALGEGDALLIAGKGHETGQIIGGKTIPYSDHDAVRAALGLADEPAEAATSAEVAPPAGSAPQAAPGQAPVAALAAIDIVPRAFDEALPRKTARAMAPLQPTESAARAFDAPLPGKQAPVAPPAAKPALNSFAVQARAFDAPLGLTPKTRIPSLAPAAKAARAFDTALAAAKKAPAQAGPKGALQDFELAPRSFDAPLGLPPKMPKAPLAARDAAPRAFDTPLPARLKPREGAPGAAERDAPPVENPPALSGPAAAPATLWGMAEILSATGGSAQGAPPNEAGGVSIDSRSLAPGDLFIAIKGDRVDGHDYVGKALEAGAAAAIVAKDYFGAAGPLIRVPDPLKALEALARAARARAGAKIVAVTGSVGKTSSKEMLRLALGASGPAHVSEKSYNNQWGVPLSLARMPAASRFGAFEIGMNHAGEITPLTRMARPHIVIITTIAAVHLEFFSSVEAIAEAKAEIFHGLEPGGAAILNRDIPQFELLERRAREAGAGRIVSFGEHQSAEARLSRAELLPDRSKAEASISGEAVSYEINAPGRHFVINSLAVLAAVKLAGADLAAAAAALAQFTTPEGRGLREVFPAAGGEILLIDESYNANPASMGAAIATLGALPRGAHPRRAAVLGDMLELGHGSKELHAKLAEAIDAADIDVVFACGAMMRSLYDALPEPKRGAYAASAEELREALLAGVEPGDAIMVKGSLGSRTGLLVKALREHLQAQAGG